MFSIIFISRSALVACNELAEPNTKAFHYVFLYTQMLKSRIKKRDNCFCIGWRGQLGAPLGGGRTHRSVRTVSPQRMARASPRPAVPSRATAQPSPQRGPRWRLCRRWDREPARSRVALHQTFLWLKFLLHWLPTYLS